MRQGGVGFHAALAVLWMLLGTAPDEPERRGLGTAQIALCIGARKLLNLLSLFRV